ncbi:MAG: factor-independent urate hydroxylase [Thermomicrobiales bacterium]
MRYDISYGKFRVPVYRTAARALSGVAPIPESAFTGRTNALLALEVDVAVLCDNFLPAYLVGDNANVVATDSMKNFIIREALDYDGATIEGFLHVLGARFLHEYAQMQTLRLTGRELPFTAVTIPDEVAGASGFAPSGVLFERGRDDHFAATLAMERGGDGPVVTAHDCAQSDIRLMKTTGSSFTSFVRDGYTTLPDRKDRPLFIYLDVGWRYGDVEDLIDPARGRYVPSEQVRDVVRAVFHQFVSESIQHLVHEIGLRLLDRFPQLAQVGFAGQNRTRDPFHASPTDPDVRVYSDPFSAYGEITLTMNRH